MPATAEPKSAKIVEGQTGATADQAAAAAATTTISVAGLPSSDEPQKPPKPGSARSRLYDDLDKKFGAKTTESTPAKPKKETAKEKETKAQEPETPPKPEAEELDKSAISPEDQTPPTAPDTTAKPGKTTPWKLVDQFKERATKAEARILELEKNAVPPEKLKELQSKFDELTKRNQEMSEDLRFYYAERYDPDVIKAKDAYTKAFTRAMDELKDVQVTDPRTEQPRALTVDDLSELAFMPLGQAQQVAKQVFGDLAPYVMDHRNEIRRMWDAQKSVLDELKKTGATREQQRSETQKKAMQEVSEFIEKTFEQAKAKIADDPKIGHWFKHREGDEEWNTRIDKGAKFVDEALGMDARDPRLTKEQRSDIIQRHAAVRNRAAAFGALRHQIETLQAKLAEREKELKEYKESTPATSGRTSEGPKERAKGLAGIFQDLEKIAR